MVSDKVVRDKLGAPRGGQSYRRFSDKGRKGLLFDGIRVWSPDLLLWKGGLGSNLGLGKADDREGVLEVIEKGCDVLTRRFVFYGKND